MNENLPISRSITIDAYKKELKEMLEMIAHFHDEFLPQPDNETAELMYARIWLGQAHYGLQLAKVALEGLSKHCEMTGKSLTELVELHHAIWKNG